MSLPIKRIIMNSYKLFKPNLQHMWVTQVRRRDDCPPPPPPPNVKRIIKCSKIYPPVGPYSENTPSLVDAVVNKATNAAQVSQAVEACRTLYVSGTLGMGPTGKMVEGGARAQTHQALCNLCNVLAVAGACTRNVVKCVVLLADMNDWQDVNEVYLEFFPSDYPARVAFQVACLPAGAAVEIEAVAMTGDVDVDRHLRPCY